MFDFIRKQTVWDGLDERYLSEFDRQIPFQLKTAQDIAIFRLLRNKTNLAIAEVGGGSSRIIQKLGENNRCFNIEKFQGVGAGPTKEVAIPGIKNIPAFIGEFSPLLTENQFDIAFSISVVEHVETPLLDQFCEDLIRVLKPGGLFFHAIDVYIEDQPTDYHVERFEKYREWITKNERIEAIGEISDSPLRFQCDMATNPDNIMHDWGRIAPALVPLRKRAQLVSLLIGGRKIQ